MKSAPEEIDPREYPELACLQSIIHDEDREEFHKNLPKSNGETLVHKCT